MVPSALGESTSTPLRKARYCAPGGRLERLADEIAGGGDGQLILSGEVAGAGAGRLGQVELDFQARKARHGQGDGIADERRGAGDDRAGLAAESELARGARNFLAGVVDPEDPRRADGERAGAVAIGECHAHLVAALGRCGWSGRASHCHRLRRRTARWCRGGACGAAVQLATHSAEAAPAGWPAQGP